MENPLRAIPPTSKSVKTAPRAARHRRNVRRRAGAGPQKAIRNLCAGANLEPRFADNWINSGKSLEAVAEEIVSVVAERSKDLTPRYRHDPQGTGPLLHHPRLRAAMSRTGPGRPGELEAHKAVMSEHGVNARSGSSFFVPMEIQARAGLNGRRDMTVAGVSGSNYLVGTDNPPGSFIDLLRNDSVVLGMGATRLTGLVGNLTIPKMTAGGTACWLADESTQITGKPRPPSASCPCRPKRGRPHRDQPPADAAVHPGRGTDGDERPGPGAGPGRGRSLPARLRLFRPAPASSAPPDWAASTPTPPTPSPTCWTPRWT